jgi:hypothetical protein
MLVFDQNLVVAWWRGHTHERVLPVSTWRPGSISKWSCYNVIERFVLCVSLPNCHGMHDRRAEKCTRFNLKWNDALQNIVLITYLQCSRNVCPWFVGFQMQYWNFYRKCACCLLQVCVHKIGSRCLSKVFLSIVWLVSYGVITIVTELEVQGCADFVSTNSECSL